MTDFPTREQILDFVARQGHKTGKREIARAFNIKGADRITLKRLLRELAAEGLLESDRRSGFYPADALPPVCVLKITHRDAEGALCAALQRGGDVQTDADAPRITIDEGATGMSRKRGGRITRAHIGDIVLARLREVSPQNYNARVMRRIGGDAEQERRIIGVARERGGQLVLLPADKRDRRDYHIAEAGTVRDGDVVNAKLLASPNNAYRRAPKRVSIESVIGRADDPTVFSHIALAEQAIRTQFPESVAQEAANASPPDFTTRTDLTHLPFITIDPADARDHDDAVCALPDPDRVGGYIVWVAIADVAAYVRPNSAMDNEARARGNSTYLPDRVVPMLPERISNDLCSLRENEARPCMAVAIHIDDKGEKHAHKFYRGVMRSRARLSYEDAQSAFDGAPNARAAPHNEASLAPLWQAYQLMAGARDRREPLFLNRAERRIELADDGTVARVLVPPQLEAHRVIEEMMVAANVCAAEVLERHKSPLIYRIHDTPLPEKMHALADFVRPMGLRIDLGQPPLPRLFNALLATADADTHTLSEIILRTQAQAVYSENNIGHFGLNLGRYAHFTSPIRRYADLVVHRALIRALGFGDDGLTDTDADALPQIAESISQCERRSINAERAASERYMAAYMASRIGDNFDARVSGISRAGLFVRLDDGGAEGLIPISTLGGGYLRADPARTSLKGQGVDYRLGQVLEVKLAEAAPLRGGLVFYLSNAPRKTHNGRKRGSRRRRR